LMWQDVATCFRTSPFWLSSNQQSWSY
jgi:hypothetical protein